MRIDPEDFRRHYAMLSDEALFALDRSELIEMAQSCYDEEVARRKATQSQPGVYREDTPLEFDGAGGSGEFEADDGPTPAWVEEAACACTFSFEQDTPDIEKARSVLRSAGIPCYVAVEQVEELPRASRVRHEYRILVPSALNLNATSVLDRDLFNQEHEADWQAQLETLSDEELGRLNPQVLCAGLLDRAARLKKAYEAEVARRRA